MTIFKYDLNTLVRTDHELRKIDASVQEYYAESPGKRNRTKGIHVCGFECDQG